MGLKMSKGGASERTRTWGHQSSDALQQLFGHSTVSTATNWLEKMKTRIQADLEAAEGGGRSCLVGDVAGVQQEAQQLVR